jgi:hypothetical protein
MSAALWVISAITSFSGFLCTYPSVEEKLFSQLSLCQVGKSFNVDKSLRKLYVIGINGK